jgi:hypothetical protein
VSVVVPSREYHCLDEAVIPASADACFDLLRRIGEYGRWWRLVRIEAIRGGPLLEPGSHFDFVGRRPGRAEVRWTCVVHELTPPDPGARSPAAIDMAYIGGRLRGPTCWEVEALPGGRASLVRYLYRGVRPLIPASAETFARYGTRLHSCAMRHDALAGMKRVLGGVGAELTDEEWDRRIAAAMARFT